MPLVIPWFLLVAAKHLPIVGTIEVDLPSGKAMSGPEEAAAARRSRQSQPLSGTRRQPTRLSGNTDLAHQRRIGTIARRTYLKAKAAAFVLEMDAV